MTEREETKDRYLSPLELDKKIKKSQALVKPCHEHFFRVNHVQPRKMIKTVKETSILLRNQVLKEKNICQANLILECLHQCNAIVGSTLLSLIFVMIASQ